MLGDRKHRAVHEGLGEVPSVRDRVLDGAVEQRGVQVAAEAVAQQTLHEPQETAAARGQVLAGVGRGGGGGGGGAAAAHRRVESEDRGDEPQVSGHL